MQAGTLTMPASTRKGEATNERRYYATPASVAEGSCPRRGGQSRKTPRQPGFEGGEVGREGGDGFGLAALDAGREVAGRAMRMKASG